MSAPHHQPAKTDKDLNIQQAILQQLESLQAAGICDLPRAAPLAQQPSPPTTAKTIVSASQASDTAITNPSSDAKTEPLVSSTSRVSLPDDSLSAPSPLSCEQREQQLTILNKEVEKCTRCPELVGNRTQTVFGVGNPNARLVFFGEAPGADEDKQGEPFVGRAGKLLNDIISKGMGLQRSDVYIMNVVKCRPPGNRNPSGAEADNCRPFFERQFEIIRPEFICCLGAIAATTLLETNVPIGRLRGRLHEYRESLVLATYHPAYLLRNPSAKKEVWKDIQLLMAEMGIRKT